MAIVVMHRFEGRLPPSALYLDDVDRIVKIIRDKTPDLYKPKQDATGAVIWGSGASVKLTVGDTTCDTVDELAQLGTVRMTFV